MVGGDRKHLYRYICKNLAVAPKAAHFCSIFLFGMGIDIMGYHSIFIAEWCLSIGAYHEY